jgi:hypothetical protein
VSAIKLPRTGGQAPPHLDRIESKFAAKVILLCACPRGAAL